MHNVLEILFCFLYGKNANEDQDLLLLLQYLARSPPLAKQKILY